METHLEIKRELLLHIGLKCKFKTLCWKKAARQKNPWWLSPFTLVPRTPKYGPISQCLRDRVTGTVGRVLEIGGGGGGGLRTTDRCMGNIRWFEPSPLTVPPGVCGQVFKVSLGLEMHLSCWSDCLECTRPWGWSPVQQKLCLVVCACNSSTCDVEAGGSVQGLLREFVLLLHREFGIHETTLGDMASLGYMRH